MANSVRRSVQNRVLSFLSKDVNYSKLYSYFNHVVNIPDRNSSYKNIERTQVASDSDYVKSITEFKGNKHLSFLGSGKRASYLNKKYGSIYDFDIPVYKSPDKDIPHISFPNVFDCLFSSSVFSTVNSPNTTVTILRSRRSVNDEGSVGIGVTSRDIGADHLRIQNSGSQVELDAASGIPIFQQIQVLLVEDNGASSRAFLNNVQLGTNKTLSAGTISQLFYGTNSHQWEHDLIFTGLKYGLFSSGERSDLQALITSFFRVNYGPLKPYLHNPIISFDGVDTFTVSSITFYDPNSIGENTSLREYEWIATRTVATIDGFTVLDSQYPIHRGATLKRGDHPDVFLPGATGTGNANVAVRVRGFNNNGDFWAGIPFRSLFIFDNILGTPVTTNQCWIDSFTVENATPTRIRVHLTSSAGGGTFSGGNVNHFIVWVNGVKKSVTADFTGLVASGNIDLTLTDPLIKYDEVYVNHIPDSNTPLQNSTGFKVPFQSSGIYIPFTNTIIGRTILKVNLTFGINTTNVSYNNVDTNGSVATILANAKDILGANTGYSVSVTDSFQGTADSTIPGSIGTVFDDGLVTQRGPHVWQGGNTNGTIRISGLTANQVFDFVAGVSSEGGNQGGTGTLVVAGSSQAIETNTYTEYSWTSLTADGSGNIDITITITQSGKTAILHAFRLTTYP